MSTLKQWLVSTNCSLSHDILTDLSGKKRGTRTKEQLFMEVIEVSQRVWTTLEYQ